MILVALTALGIGGATMVGAVLGYLFQTSARRLCAPLTAFSAGVMLAAAMTGLILPALETPDLGWTAIAGIAAGGICISRLDRLFPAMQRLLKLPRDREAILFLTAMAIHNLPEGLAAGVSFGADSPGASLLIAGSIALQNFPEGMVVIPPLLRAGVSPGKTLALALGTGLVEVLGTFLGYFSLGILGPVLPFALAFAGGTMVFVIAEEMMPQCRGCSHLFLAGLSAMMALCLIL